MTSDKHHDALTIGSAIMLYLCEWGHWDVSQFRYTTAVASLRCFKVQLWNYLETKWRGETRKGTNSRRTDPVVSLWRLWQSRRRRSDIPTAMKAGDDMLALWPLGAHYDFCFLTTRVTGRLFLIQAVLVSSTQHVKSCFSFIPVSPCVDNCVQFET